LRRFRPVLLLQLGEAPEAVRLVHGPFATWYERAWGGGLTTHDGREGPPLPDPRDLAGVIVSGSAASLTRPEPWMEDAAAFVVSCRDAGVPVLGVCFGHQLLAVAFGGQVEKNPRGWEIGTTPVSVLGDPLFEGLPATLRVNMVHEDMVAPEELPAGVTPLAATDHTRVAALAIGEHVRGVQFHPEVTGAIVRGYIDARRSRLHGVDPDVLLARASDTPDGVAVLRNFRARFVEKS
jgi:GMP synthase (glutamine-hydrolysing)